jgi:hypothetical protein
MPTDLTVVLTDEPGELAKLSGAIGEAGINIHGVCAFTGEGRGIIHLLVGDKAADRAISTLEQEGLRVADHREVLVVDIEDRPGSLAQLARELAAAGVNIELLYTTFGAMKVVIATDDMHSARAALA